MKQSFVSEEEFSVVVANLAEDYSPSELGGVLYGQFIVKRKTPAKISCALLGCGKQVTFKEARGWFRIRSIERLNDKKQWEALKGENTLPCCCKEHLLKMIEFLLELPY